VDKELFNAVKKLKFRKDINFLRALSVLSVIIYHINKGLLPGGWLGVDIFFFISGYLISNKIVIDLKNKEFKLKSFYTKRIKRIIPGLVSVLSFSVPFAYFLLPPKELQLFLKSFQSSLLFYSNFHFENLDFYNLPSTNYFPLLHMWSLSIEEQYYIIFPILFFLIFKINKNYLFKSVSFVILISLTLNLFSFGNSIFYQLPFRIWEFLLGVIFMFLESRLGFKKYSKHLGLTIILLSLIFFEDILINEVYTKLFCLFGVFLYLIESEESNFIKVLNRNKWLQKIGLISFSLYLFHQPIFAFFKIYTTKVESLNSWYYLILIIFLFLISHLNWKFVEIPFQNNFNKNKQLALGVVFMLFCISSFTLLNDDSFINRYTDVPQKAIQLSFKNQDTISQNGITCDNRNITNACEFKVPDPDFTVYVLGDSSLRTLSTALLEYQFENFDLIHFTADNCLYLTEIKLNNNACPNNTVRGMDQFINEIRDSVIIYGGRIPRYLSGTGFDNSFVAEENSIEVIPDFEKRLNNTLQKLATKNTVILLYPIPEQGWNVPELYFYNKVNWGDPVSYPSSIWDERVKRSNMFLNTVTSENIIRIFPDQIFCNSFIIGQCVGAIETEIFYSDDDHLSLEGSRLLAKEIMTVLPINE
tara:strand:- start:45891 stop:47822 length:1932 start_codon:yes stop_codon:yes gene_type:complete